ncbi:acyl-CoA dehydrogenase NM domain-like protein [Dendrothele bispora CBS 962.96]|uniref:Acyl-CoA dehydrogenase NM domain-like protein n=1 Tax=Dendrothele bispora (strain CBS 962.96) TaxID=1314807 RepID=A0A4S8KWW6_DENBC|nr:acyl-CoA dehydrogenase NM domain-like protein [Dendrothele bispora CBS 962.96]
MRDISPTSQLSGSELFSTRQEVLDNNERVRLSHRRAKAIANSYNITKEDIKYLTPNFFALHADHLHLRDTSAATNITIQYNVALGTLIDYGGDKPELQGLIEDVIAYRVNLQFLLTEQGHGLDVINMETRVTMLDDGTLDLHSSTPQASKFMPSTIPMGIPCVGIVMARLIIQGADHGVRAFIVPLNDGKEMCTGVQARKLPPRDDSDTVNHSLTSFNHVKLPLTALLGNIDKPSSDRTQFLSVIKRVTIGTFIVAGVAIPSLQLAVYTAAKYSQRRKLQVAAPKPYALWNLKTQQVPILYGFVDSVVFKALVEKVVPKFRDPITEGDLLRAYAAICKILFYKHHQKIVETLIGRMGAQGVFRYNGLTAAHGMIRGYSIGEGETLALSIRLATELLLGRYSLESPDKPNSFLARYEAGIFQSCAQILAQLPSHRSKAFESLIAPRCPMLIEALAHRLAYDAATSAGVHPAVVDLFEMQAIQRGAWWYIEKGLLTGADIYDRTQSALDKCLPVFEKWLKAEESGIGKYVQAPIIDGEAWDEFLETLPEFIGHEGSRRDAKL